MRYADLAAAPVSAPIAFALAMALTGDDGGGGLLGHLAATVTGLATHTGWLYAGTLLAAAVAAARAVRTAARWRVEAGAEEVTVPQAAGGEVVPGGPGSPTARLVLDVGGELVPGGSAGPDVAGLGSGLRRRHRRSRRCRRCSAARPGRSPRWMPWISGRNLSALRLTPPPMTKRSGEKSISTWARYFCTRWAQCSQVRSWSSLALEDAFFSAS